MKIQPERLGVKMTESIYRNLLLGIILNLMSLIISANAIFISLLVLND